MLRDTLSRAAVLTAAALILAVLASPEVALAAAAPAEGGEPEILDFQRWDLGLWTLIVFGLLLLVLRSTAWKPIMEGLEKREQNILEARDDAVRARQEAEVVREQLRQELNQAHQKAREIVDEARRDGQALVETMRAKAQSEIQDERDRLRREVELAKDQALQEIWTSSVQLASLMTSKVVRRELSAEDHGRLLDETLVELGQKLGGKPGSAGTV